MRRAAAACALGAARIARAGDAANGLKVGIISDEVDTDFENALRWIRDQGLEWVELRNLWGTYVTDLKPAEIARARDLLAQYGLKVSMIDSAFLKTTLPGSRPIPQEQMLDAFGNYPYDDHDKLLGRALGVARAFGVNRVRVFSYWRDRKPGSVFDEVKGRLARAAEAAERYGFVLVLENEYACNVATGAELAAMLKAIPSRGLAGLWDPGNAQAAGERPYPDGYGKLDKTRLVHLHLKDVVVHGTKWNWAPVGAGAIDMRGQLRALARDRFDGVVSLETHYVPTNGTKQDASLRTLAGLRGILSEL